MPGHTTGIWIPEDSDLLDRLDATYADQDRSGVFRDAAELQLAVDGVLATEGVDIPRGTEQRHFIRQAIRTELRREADE